VSRPTAGAAGNAADWLGAAKREEREQGERKARRVAREQAEREHFGPGGRPSAAPATTQAQEEETL
jgi:hypothetical protein